MKKDSIEAVDDSAIVGLAEQQGEAKYSLCENAAAAARGARRQLTLRTAVIIGLALSLAQWGASASYGKYHSGYWFWETKAKVSFLESENLKLKAEVNRAGLRENSHLATIDDQHELLKVQKNKLNWRNETERVFMGFITGHTNYLESALTINPDRPNGFPFREWNPSLTEKLLEYAINAFHLDVLQWVTEQPEWYSIVNEGLVDKINLTLKDYTSTHTPNWKEVR
jgi:hypothetical protein